MKRGAAAFNVRQNSAVMTRERSIESRIQEHKKFREQCRRRIRPTLTLFLISLGAVTAWICFLPTSWWIAAGVLAFTGVHVLLEVRGFRFHNRKLRELTNPRRGRHADDD
jgi:hypothetical protein